MPPVLGFIRARLAVLLAVSALPIVGVAVVLAALSPHPARGIAAIVVAAIAGLTIALSGTGRIIALPMHRLADAVEQWRETGAFRQGALRGAPVEVEQLAGAFAHAADALAEHEDRARESAAQQVLLMQEIHHRVKNNLQIVASLLNLQASRIRLPEAKAEFQSARDRVRALATLHRHLYLDGGLHSINMPSFLTELCGQLFQAMGEREGDRIRLEIEATELQMSSDQAVPVSLIVTEAVSNAVRYAFPDGRRGRISVRFAVDGEIVRLVMEDDGIGIPEGYGETPAGPRDGLGIRLIRGFASQLGATLEVRQGEGTRYSLAIPLHRERSEDAVAPAAHARSEVPLTA